MLKENRGTTKETRDVVKEVVLHLLEKSVPIVNAELVVNRVKEWKDVDITI